MTYGAAWDHAVVLSDLFRRYNEDLDLKAVRDGSVARLRALRIDDAEFKRLVGRLARVRTENGFNNALDALYDWGDGGKRLWISTF